MTTVGPYTGYTDAAAIQEGGLCVCAALACTAAMLSSPPVWDFPSHSTFQIILFARHARVLLGKTRHAGNRRHIGGIWRENARVRRCFAAKFIWIRYRGLMGECDMKGDTTVWWGG